MGMSQSGEELDAPSKKCEGCRPEIFEGGYSLPLY